MQTNPKKWEAYFWLYIHREWVYLKLSHSNPPISQTHLRDSHDQQPTVSSGLSQNTVLAQDAQSVPPLYLTKDITIFLCPKASDEYYTDWSSLFLCFHKCYSLEDVILIWLSAECFQKTPKQATKKPKTEPLKKHWDNHWLLVRLNNCVMALI